MRNAGDAYDGAEITEAEYEVTQRAERPVVDTDRTVPVEPVKQTVSDEPDGLRPRRSGRRRHASVAWVGAALRSRSAASAVGQ